MNLYREFEKLNIDHAAIGLKVYGTEEPCFCTPKGARIIGSAGLDGIHYCFVRGQGETVFAVNPSNTPGGNVFPIAESFGDLLRLLVACGSMAALEQAHQWDEEQFAEFVADNPPTQTQREIFAVLREKLGIEPWRSPLPMSASCRTPFAGSCAFPRNTMLCAAAPSLSFLRSGV